MIVQLDFNSIRSNEKFLLQKGVFIPEIPKGKGLSARHLWMQTLEG